MKPKNVLIADDDAMLVRVLTVRCRHLGLAVRQASDAMLALVMIHKDPPDLVIILSGITDVGCQRDIIRLGAERWINKPFEIKEFIKIVKDRIGLP